MIQSQPNPQDHHSHLKTIKGIEFTTREIDVIACILNGRTAQKTIASFLTTPSRTVSPRTVETHLRNIIRKLGCGTQSGIIEFIEKSDKRSLLRDHYEYLREFKDKVAPANKDVPDSNSAGKSINSFPSTLADFLKNRWKWLFPLITFSASLLYLVDWLGQDFKVNRANNLHKSPIHSDLLVPLEATLLQRPYLMEQLKEKLKGEQGIQIVTLVGIGGAGKTTLARNYAQQQKASFIWEINAETLLSLIQSFEKMADAFCQTEEDHKFLNSVKAIQNTIKREEQILTFVKDKLKEQSNWFLIYDNVEKISDIQKYVPFDAYTWGNGKVIITTRDSHIRQHRYVHHTISIEELNPQEKLELFMKIMSYEQEKGFTTAQREEAKQFLEKVGSFPLDVLVAAHYLKETKARYDQYLEHLSHYTLKFDTLQQSLLKDANIYSDTRYKIISSSIDRLLRIDKDFEELMLLISLIDSQNIPRELLKR